MRISRNLLVILGVLTFLALPASAAEGGTPILEELMKKYTVKTSDPVTNDVIDRIFIRHQQGMKKFQKTMAQNSKSIPEWIEDVIEEQIDSICYLSTLKDRVKKRENDLLKEIDRLRDDNQIAWLHTSKLEERIKKMKDELHNGKKTKVGS